MLVAAICYWASFVLLLGTKAADVVTTWRHVAARAETNPFARSLFARYGVRAGIAIVCVLFLALASLQYYFVWWQQSEPLLWANTALGLAIAWVQFDVARANATGRSSHVTRTALRLHGAWDALLRKRRRRG